MKRKFFTSLLLVLCAAMLHAQDSTGRKIRGWVRDSLSFEPLSGATIRIPTLERQTQTNAQGYFEVTVPREVDRLQVSYAEYSSQWVSVPAGRQTIQVLLEQAPGTLKEVVVYNDGYSRTTANKATGSYTRLSNESLNEVVETNILDRLKYMTNGLQQGPAGVSTPVSGLLLIRGLSTMTTQIQKPLIILDNFPFEGDINYLNPNDVEDIVVLKDAAASSIWGARAANGVIVINTKKGKMDQPVRVNFRANYTVDEKPDLHKIPALSTSDLIDIETYLYQQGRFDHYFNVQNAAAPTDLAWTLRKLENGEITQSEADAYINQLRTRDVRNEYEKYFYRSAQAQQYSLSLEGGSRQASWRISGGWDRNISSLAELQNRVTLNSSLQVKLGKGTTVSTQMLFSQMRKKNGRPEYGSSNYSDRIPSYARFVDEAGNPIPIDWVRGREFIDTAGAGYLLDWKFYPLTNHLHETDMFRLQNMAATIELNQRVFDGLDVSVSYRYQKDNQNLERYYGIGGFYARDMINRFAQHDYANNRMLFPVPKGGILFYGNTSSLQQNFRSQINYRKSIAGNPLRILLGAETSQTESDDLYDRRYGYNPELLSHVQVNFNAPYYDFANGYSINIPGSSIRAKRLQRFVSFYSNASYTLNDKYTFSASARRDASNLFGVTTNNRWKPLWSAGLSWNISKEKFYKLPWMPELRIRSSIGHQGNMDARKVAVTTIRYENTNPQTLLVPATIDNYPNPNLRWEQTSIFNLAAEGQSRDGRLSVQVEFFNKEISDMYQLVPIDQTAGLGSNVLRNIGKMCTRGWDIQLNGKILQGILNWETDFIFNRTRSVTRRYQKGEDAVRFVTGMGLRGVEGFDAASYFAYRWAGLDPTNGDPMGYLDGAPSNNYLAITGTGTKFSDLVYVGSILPLWTSSWGHHLQWKTISLRFRLMGSFGHFFTRPTYNSNDLESGRGYPDYLRRWQKPGDELHTNVPSYRYPNIAMRESFYQQSEVLAEKADHIRLQYVNLSFSPRLGPQSRGYIQSLNIALIANNLGVIWKATKVPGDPNSSLTGLPPLKRISLSFSATF